MTDAVQSAGIGLAIAIPMALAFIWIAKRLTSTVTMILTKLVTSAIEDMKANTDAMRNIAEEMKKDAAVRHERDRSMFKALERIETHVSKR